MDIKQIKEKVLESGVSTEWSLCTKDGLPEIITLNVDQIVDMVAIEVCEEILLYGAEVEPGKYLKMCQRFISKIDSILSQTGYK